jgi:hypothetical protein
VNRECDNGGNSARAGGLALAGLAKGDLFVFRKTVCFALRKAVCFGF